jgi:hypothetical protein
MQCKSVLQNINFPRNNDDKLKIRKKRTGKEIDVLLS